MDKNRLVYKCYEFQLSKIHVNRYDFWAKNVKLLLQSYGFGEVWEHQGVGNEIVFLYIFKQRCIDIDIDIQQWSEDLSKSRKLYVFGV